MESTGKSSIAILINFISFNLQLNILNIKWCLTLIIFILFTSFYINDSIVTYALFYGVIPEDLNIWSGMHLYLGNLINVFIIFIPLFILLTAGLIKQNALESIVLGLIGSKYRWWIGKFITLMIMTAIYVFFLVVVSFAISFCSVPWDATWDGTFLANHFDSDIINLNPIYAMSLQVILLYLGCLFWGTITLVVSVSFPHKKSLAPLIGFSSLAIAYIFYYLHIGSSFFNISSHLSLYSSFIAETWPYVWSLIFWFILILTLFLIGLLHAGIHDFIHEKEY